MPDSRVAVGLTDGRNPSIFLLSSSFQKESKLEGSNGIDVSPSVDAAGRLMAFTSSRAGGPQIYVKDLSSGSVRRASMSGDYNTDPSISPDGTLVARKFEAWSNQGAYASHGHSICAKAMGSFAQIYPCDNMECDGWTVFTNRPAAGAMRG